MFSFVSAFVTLIRVIFLIKLKHKHIQPKKENIVCIMNDCKSTMMFLLLIEGLEKHLLGVERLFPNINQYWSYHINTCERFVNDKLKKNIKNQLPLSQMVFVIYFPSVHSFNAVALSIILVLWGKESQRHTSLTAEACALVKWLVGALWEVHQVSES